MKVIELPEQYEGQFEDLQNLINQTEEDLLCAIFLYRRCKNSYQPNPNICYLLHQTIEKWLKIYIQVKGILFPEKKRNTHSLASLLSRAGQQDQEFNTMLSQIDQADPIMSRHTYPEHLRYAEKPEMYENVDGVHIGLLFRIVFRVRRIVKKAIREELR